VRRNRRPGFLADPHDLDDHEIFDDDLALYGIFKKLCHWAAHGDYTDTETGQPLKRGEVLTSERQLAEKFGISRIVVSRCLRDLQANGFIDRPVDRPANRPVGSIIIISNYDTLFGKKKRNRPANRPANRPVAENVPLYVSKQNLHTQDAQGVCAVAPQGEDTLPASDEGAQKLADLWNASVASSDLAVVSDMPLPRQSAAKAAIRARNSLSWWRGVFESAAKTGPLPQSGWRVNFDFALSGINATRILEGHFPKSKQGFKHKIFSERDF